jgi:hypothetical protein
MIKNYTVAKSDINDADKLFVPDIAFLKGKKV